MKSISVDKLQLKSATSKDQFTNAEFSCCLLNPSVPYNTEFLSRDKEFCSHLIAISFSYVIT